jgi:hypothetical protein
MNIHLQENMLTDIQSSPDLQPSIGLLEKTAIMLLLKTVIVILILLIHSRSGGILLI